MCWMLFFVVLKICNNQLYHHRSLKSMSDCRYGAQTSYTYINIEYEGNKLRWQAYSDHAVMGLSMGGRISSLHANICVTCGAKESHHTYWCHKHSSLYRKEVEIIMHQIISNEEFNPPNDPKKETACLSRQRFYVTQNSSCRYFDMHHIKGFCSLL